MVPLERVWRRMGNRPRVGGRTTCSVSFPFVSNGFIEIKQPSSADLSFVASHSTTVIISWVSRMPYDDSGHSHVVSAPRISAGRCCGFFSLSLSPRLSRSAARVTLLPQPPHAVRPYRYLCISPFRFDIRPGAHFFLLLTITTPRSSSIC